MKALSILAFLCLIYDFCNAQSAFINPPQEKVIGLMDADTTFKSQEKFNESGVTYMWYDKKHSKEDDYHSLLLSFKNSICIMYEIVDLKEKLSRYPVTLNKLYTKQDKDTWVDIAHSRSYVLKVNNDGFLGLYVRSL